MPMFTWCSLYRQESEWVKLIQTVDRNERMHLFLELEVIFGSVLALNKLHLRPWEQASTIWLRAHPGTCVNTNVGLRDIRRVGCHRFNLICVLALCKSDGGWSWPAGSRMVAGTLEQSLFTAQGQKKKEKKPDFSLYLSYSWVCLSGRQVEEVDAAYTTCRHLRLNAPDCADDVHSFSSECSCWQNIYDASVAFQIQYGKFNKGSNTEGRARAPQSTS